MPIDNSSISFLLFLSMLWESRQASLTADLFWNLRSSERPSPIRKREELEVKKSVSLTTGHWWRVTWFGVEPVTWIGAVSYYLNGFVRSLLQFFGRREKLESLFGKNLIKYAFTPNEKKELLFSIKISALERPGFPGFCHFYLYSKFRKLYYS